MIDKWNKIYFDFVMSLQPPPDMSVAEWADEFRVLPQSGSDGGGKWSTSKVPYMREIMEKISPRDHCEDVVFMKGSQVSGTEVLLNLILFSIEHNPSPILLIEPTLSIAEDLSKVRLENSINEMPSIKNLIGDQKSRSKSGTILNKHFPGGRLAIRGANSPSDLRSIAVKIMCCDEVDAYPLDVGKEGDPLSLLKRRTTNFSRPKRFYVSTPTDALTTRIGKMFDDSDQRYYYVPCPHCSEKQILRRENFIYDDNDPDTVRVKCVHCKAEIYEHNKTWMLEHGEWRALNPRGKYPGYHLSALYSPQGWYSWRAVVYDYLDAIGNPNMMRVWVNTVLGEPWDDGLASFDGRELLTRCETYSHDVPDPVLLLTCGTDTQDNRLESAVYGWSMRDGQVEQWLIDYRIFYGDTKKPTVWEEFEAFLSKTYTHANGLQIGISSIGIDAMGHATDEVYKFVNKNSYRKIFAMQGKSGAGKPIAGRAFQNKKYKIYLHQVGTDGAKDLIYSRLSIKDNSAGCMRFPDSLPRTDDGQERKLDAVFFDQLTAEKKKIKYVSGTPRYYWDCPKGKRNEVLDCTVYATAALNILNPNLKLLAKEKKILGGNYQKSTVRNVQRRIYSQGVTL